MSDRPSNVIVGVDQSLTMAMVAASPAPMLLLDGDLKVIAASTSFCEAFDIKPDLATGRKVFALGAGEWRLPLLRKLLEATAGGVATEDSYEMDLMRPGQATRRVIVQPRLLSYLDLSHPRIIVTMSDVTELRANQKTTEAVLHQNAISLGVLRHRVANSLQIIASLLSRSARRTQSDETRRDLNDAYQRVMSVAALEMQLSANVDGDVRLHDYFSELCGSISASMIADRETISLVVTGADGVVPASVALSLGLVVTELVINALKHAFPDGRKGVVAVNFERQGARWMLSVTDDGVGRPSDQALVHLGMGTSIVQALANQLQASLRVDSANPGTKVSIEHSPISLVASAAESVYGVVDTENSAIVKHGA